MKPVFSNTYRNVFNQIMTHGAFVYLFTGYNYATFLDVIRLTYIIKRNVFVFFAGNGYIEGTELDGFLREFVSSANTADVSPEVLL